MVRTSAQLEVEDAPCGKRVGGRWRRDTDDHGLVLENLTYDCGCRHIHYQFRDGSGHTRFIRHDGKVLMEEHSPERGE